MNKNSQPFPFYRFLIFNLLFLNMSLLCSVYAKYKNMGFSMPGIVHFLMISSGLAGSLLLLITLILLIKNFYKEFKAAF